MVNYVDDSNAINDKTLDDDNVDEKREKRSLNLLIRIEDCELL